MGKLIIIKTLINAIEYRNTEVYQKTIIQSVLIHHIYHAKETVSRPKKNKQMYERKIHSQTVLMYNQYRVRRHNKSNTETRKRM